MVPFVYTARENHGVTSAEDYLQKHASFIAKKAKRGSRVVVHDAVDPIAARVDANRWLVDCECGNCCATDPAWAVACCYDCGAIHRTVVFPDDEMRELFESVLVERWRPMDRGWAPGETLVDLVAENVSIGADVPDAVIEAIARGGQP